MAKAKRVFEVAKELGVTSKAIVVKCQAEGVPDITNHMSTVKVGLEVTIKEWFGDAAQVATATAIETTDKVDLAKARKGVRRRKATEKSTEPEPALTSPCSIASAKRARNVATSGLKPGVLTLARLLAITPMAASAAPIPLSAVCNTDERDMI